MIILVKPKLLRIISFSANIAGMALFPYILVSDSKFLNNKTFINHEKIHLRQQIEMGILIFYIWYGIEYLFRLIQYKNRFLAYKNISFEREAYKNETNLQYLKQRKFYNFIYYLFLND